MPTAESQVAWTEGLQRPRYFARQLVTPAELNLGSGYFMNRWKRHIRMLHGWGVVCGALVCRGPAPWKLELRPGYILDGHGNEVIIDVERVVDLRATSVAVSCGDPAGELNDAWCGDVWTERDGGTVYVAVCHLERKARPVRVQPSGCGCDDSACEFSRWQEGYEVRFLDDCPESHKGPPPTPAQFLATLSGGLRPCPPCPKDPCVVLAAVDYEADGTITRIDNCSCRRMVVSLADLWWRCSGGAVKVDTVVSDPVSPIPPGTEDVTVTVTGENLRGDSTVDLGPGVTVESISESGGTLTVSVDIAPDAAPGPRILTITNPDCSTVTSPEALTVAAPAKPKPKGKSKPKPPGG
jgi:hypothetical protein